jgi:ribosomal protein S18 acetylase RimI-like enzyme
MDVNIRRVKETDISLIKKISEETGWKSIPASERSTLNREKWNKHVEGVFERIFKKESSEIFVAEDENHTFLGYVLIGENINMITGASHGFIYDIFVKEEYRGKGVGTTLLEKAESYCREKGYPRVGLMVSTDNQLALKLYTKMGFKAEQMFMKKELS